MAPGEWALIAQFVRQSTLTAQSMYDGRYETKDMIGAVAWLTRWVTQVACLPMEPSVIFHRDTIAEYVAHGCESLTPGSRSTRRAMLLRVAEAVLPTDERVTRLESLHRDNPGVPYSEFEQRKLRSWAEGQTTPTRRLDCQVILALGLGAGLPSGDILRLRVRDITVDDLGVLLLAGSEGAVRDVPVLGSWEQVLVDLGAVREPDEWVVGVQRLGGKNWLSDFFARTQPEGGLRPSPLRMRNTWLVHHMSSGTPLGPLAAAAGLETFRTIEKLLPFVPEPTQDEVRRAMRRALRSVV